MRRLTIHTLASRGHPEVNPLYRLYETVPFHKVFWNVCVATCAQWCPSMSGKRWMYRTLLGMSVGRHAAFAFRVMVDLLRPEWITIGSNSIIGYGSTILTHEYLVREYRFGPVDIGNDVVIGANTTVLAGVKIGDGSVIGAGSVVTADIPSFVFAAGVPARVVRSIVDRT